MRTGITLAAVLLTANVTFAQTATDMATLERSFTTRRRPTSGTHGHRSRRSRDPRRVRLPAGQGTARRGRHPRAPRLSDRLDRFLTRVNGNNSDLTRRTAASTIAATSRRPARTGTIATTIAPRTVERSHRLARTLESDRQRARCQAGDRTDFRYREGRGPRRGHHDDRPVSRQRRDRAGGFADHRLCVVGRPRQPHRSPGQPDHRVHASDRERP